MRDVPLETPWDVAQPSPAASSLTSRIAGCRPAQTSLVALAVAVIVVVVVAMVVAVEVASFGRRDVLLGRSFVVIERRVWTRGHIFHCKLAIELLQMEFLNQQF